MGQKVRIARSSTPFVQKGGKGGRPPIVVEGMVGKEAVVIGTISHPNAGFLVRGFFDTSIRLENGIIGMAPSVCLEPATDSYDLASWDTCIWKPEHLRVKA